MKPFSKKQSGLQNPMPWEPELNKPIINILSEDSMFSMEKVSNIFDHKTETKELPEQLMVIENQLDNLEKPMPKLIMKYSEETMNQAFTALKSNRQDPTKTETIKVDNDSTTLENQLQRNYQRKAVKINVKYFSDNQNVTKQFNPVLLHEKEENDSEDTIERSWTLDECDIRVRVSGKRAILSGTVFSWNQKEEAERIAWKTRGIWHVNNELTIDF